MTKRTMALVQGAWRCRSLLLVLWICLHSVVLAEDTSVASFTLFDNGASSGGVEVSLARSEFRQEKEGDEDEDDEKGVAFAMDMSRRIEVSKYKAPKPVLAIKAFREDGERVTTFEQLLPENGDDTPSRRRVYLVAEGLEFVWPFVALGHNQTVSSKALPPIAEGAPLVVLESMSDKPRVFRIYNMFSPVEAQAIIDNALNLTGKDALKRSTVGSSKDENDETMNREDVGRTSHNAWDHESPAAKAMIQRSFLLTTMEEDSGKRDGLQVVRYTPGQGYNTHPDYFVRTDDDEFNFYPYSGGSNRFATVFMYLNDVEQGGFTVFPRADGVVPSRDPPADGLAMFKSGSWEHTVTKQCYSKLALPAKLGTAALFYSVTPDGQIDPSSHHGACPVLSGTKWGANIWLWNRQRYGDVQTGDRRSVTFINAATDPEETVYITWEGRDNGVIEPGTSIKLDTFEYHRFNARFGGHKNGPAFDYFTVQNEPDHQTWTIKRPKVHTLEEDDEEEEDDSDDEEDYTVEDGDEL
mmetsp:Transcript_16382/g.29799  ORF Transcript_16382/g.29799 Transcript_16382/m.29799 type:complete len:524 (-) Transcript_16382:146-1717(-)